MHADSVLNINSQNAFNGLAHVLGIPSSAELIRGTLLMFAQSKARNDKL